MIHYKIEKRIGSSSDYFLIKERGFFKYYLLSENRYPTQQAAINAILNFTKGMAVVIHTTDEKNIYNTY